MEVTSLSADPVVANVTRIVPSTLITGDFTLSINNWTTTAIPYDASEAQMKSAIEALNSGVVTVSRDGPDQVNGYTWYITFTASYFNYDVPEMT